MNNLAGIWYSELGSTMTLSVTNNTIAGTYVTPVGNANGTYLLAGLTDTANDQSQAIGWVVVWQNASGSSESVTTWSGQLQIINGLPIIVTTWLLTVETSPTDDWCSTLIGKDTFTKLKPTEAQIVENSKKGVKQSHPLKG